ncbi:MAG: hypothetical protein ACYC35_25410 [Pirellulales bacterium]
MLKRKKADRAGRKMSDIMKEMSQQLFRDPEAYHSSEAAHVALYFANLAWNECIGLGVERELTKNVWQTIEADNPNLWEELKSKDIDGMIDELVRYKQAHFPDDRRRILTCGGTDHSTIRVEWLAPAAPGVDAKWETQLYGMVRMGMEEDAVGFLKKTRGMARGDAMMEVARIRIRLGMF